MKGSGPLSAKDTATVEAQAPPAPASTPPVETRKQRNDRMAQAFADNLNRNVMAEHEQGLARLPSEVRASRTPEQWLETPPLEILKLARDAKAKATE